MVNGGTPHDGDRAELEKLWRHRLEDARLRLEFARNYYREIKRDFSDGGISAPVERFEFDKALRAETAALREYSRILAILNDLTIHGKIPNEDEQHKTAGEGQ